jgi:hypothetical protein
MGRSNGGVSPSPEHRRPPAGRDAGWLKDGLDQEVLITAVAVGVTALIGEVPFFIWLLVKGFGKKNREATS